MYATFVASESFGGIKKRGKHLCPNHLSEKKVRNAIQIAHSCTHLGSKLSSSCSLRLNYIIWHYNQNKENFKPTATDNILIYYKPVWYDLLSKEDFASEILHTLHIHLTVGGHIWRGFYLFWKVQGIRVYKFLGQSKQVSDKLNIQTEKLKQLVEAKRRKEKKEERKGGREGGNEEVRKEKRKWLSDD